MLFAKLPAGHIMKQMRVSIPVTVKDNAKRAGVSRTAVGQQGFAKSSEAGSTRHPPMYGGRLKQLPRPETPQIGAAVDQVPSGWLVPESAAVVPA